MSFISTIQYWINQLSLSWKTCSNQEELKKKQMVGNKQSQPEVEVVLYAEDKGRANCSFKRSCNDSNDSKVEVQIDKGCFRCGKPGHIKHDC